MLPLRTYIVCCGLGRINRGFESFTRECFDALAQRSDLDIRLFKGAGAGGRNELAIPTLPRNSFAAGALGAVTKRGLDKRYRGEAYSFASSLLPHLLRDRPDIVLFSDAPVGELLILWRRLFRLPFKLLFSNGGPRRGRELFRWDHIQQVSPQYLEEALAAGVPASAQTLLPYGHNISQALDPLNLEAKTTLRRRLGLPTDRKIILSVGAILTGGHKRLEYLIDEIARMPEPRPFLVILGEKEKGADNIERLAASLISAAGFTIRTVPRPVVDSYYKAADLFVLASLQEGFGRVFVEAMAQGLQCVTHDYLTAHYVLDPHGKFGNLNQAGALANLIIEQLSRPDDVQEQVERHRTVYNRFSWDAMTSSYIDMLRLVNLKQVNSQARGTGG